MQIESINWTRTKANQPAEQAYRIQCSQWCRHITKSCPVQRVARIVLVTSEELRFGPQDKGNQRLITTHLSPKNIYQPTPQLRARLFCAG